MQQRLAALIEEFERACSVLNADERERLREMLEYGLTPDAAMALLMDGRLEEAEKGAVPLKAWSVSLTPSAQGDLESFHPGWPVRIRLEALLGQLSFSTTQDRKRCHNLDSGCFWLLHDDALRILFKWEPNAPRGVVYAITCAAVNPLAKVWRYFDQAKALDLIQTGELYFRRADLLPGDPLEVRLPTQSKRMLVRAFRGVFGADAERFAEEHERHTVCTTYVCCWTRREFESHMAWSHYCSKADGRHGGGFAIQTRWRRLIHFHSARRLHDADFFCRKVGYLKPDDALPTSDQGESAFWKRIWFSDETEIRLATLRLGSGTSDEIDERLRSAPDAERIRCDLDSLTESLVWNPFASNKQREDLSACLRTYRPELFTRLRESAIPRPAP